MKQIKHHSKSLIFFISLFIACTFCSTSVFAQSAGFNYTGAKPHSSAILDISDSAGIHKGLLIPRMKKSSRDSIVYPATGLIIYQTDNTPGFYYNSGNPLAKVWVNLSSGGSSDGIKNNLGISGGTTLIGGTGASDALIFRTTSAVSGAAGSDIIFQGANGAPELMRIKTGSGQSGASATGGTITYSGGYTIHTFTSNGTFTPNGSLNVEYLVVAGGGGGGKPDLSGDAGGGGGGAGGFLTSTMAVSATPYSITVGAGGAGGVTPGSMGANGSNSIFNTITATGGGRGGISNYSPNAGGSGGGATYGSITGGAASPAGQGNKGGDGVTDNFAGGGGGGAGAVGNNAGGSGTAGTGGNGGAGLASLISGASIMYAAGGGGGTYQVHTPGSGGSGIGGNGGSNGGSGTNATANTGSGGGGGGANYISSGNAANSGNGGNGASGVVIIRYLTPSASSDSYIGIGTSSPTMKLQVYGGRFGTSQGIDVASANDLTLGSDGNAFRITGTTQINAITKAGWQAGSEVTLIFAGSINVKNNTAGGTGTGLLYLDGSIDHVFPAKSTLKLVFDGTYWYEVSRSNYATAP